VKFLTCTEVRNVYNLLGDRKVLDLIDLEDMTDKKYLAAVSLLHSSIICCFFIDTDLTLYIAAKVTSFSIMHGNTSNSCLSYILFGWLEKHKWHIFDYINDWGMLALNLSEKYSSESKKVLAAKDQVWFIYGGSRPTFSNVYNQRL
jgi:predicted ATPase